MEPWARGLQAGVDEVGIGPLAGPVYAAAVILNPTRSIDGLNDSKVLNKKRRESLCGEIKRVSIAWCIGRASVGEVDQLNVLRASHLAMQRAVDGLSHTPDMVLVDGNKKPPLAYPVMAIVRGDGRVPADHLAGQQARVARDDGRDRDHGHHKERVEPRAALVGPLRLARGLDLRAPWVRAGRTPPADRRSVRK